MGEDTLKQYLVRLEDMARASGLDFHPVEFELVPPSFMMEVAVYGLPVRMPHWSFGVRYIYELVQHKMGHSRIFEVVFPGSPSRAYMSNTNSLQENTLVVAHVLGHADFAKNNLSFKAVQEQVGFRIVDQAAAHAHQIEQSIAEHGIKRVEEVLDAALALEQHIDDSRSLRRPPFKKYAKSEPPPSQDEFKRRFTNLPGESVSKHKQPKYRRAPIPPHPEHDLLWFIALYAPEMDDWERDIFLAVREESFYFHPVFSCHLMNEGWASYWHARLLREASFLPDAEYVDAIKTHSDVVRPFAGEHEVALALNPYHLGFSLWDKVIEEYGLERARKIMEQEEDTGFVRNYLDADMARELGLFTYTAKRGGEIKVEEWDIDALHEAILRPKYNFGTPRVYVSELQSDGTLVLRQDHLFDGRGLDTHSARKVLGYISKVWRRPVLLYTVNSQGQEEVLRTDSTN